ncbi:methyl-accepting chemotaxis protein [Alkalicoccus luteus]|uniref:Methyl-accepting transducer domain-containing protein n=1 Tax=Alkalicoccus luteus TaxID=1237094 RepID=A0A969TTK7_9BACI|nr:hypothetical protein [Alkalicoccus luteus]
MSIVTEMKEKDLQTKNRLAVGLFAATVAAGGLMNFILGDGQTALVYGIQFAALWGLYAIAVYLIRKPELVPLLLIIAAHLFVTSAVFLLGGGIGVAVIYYFLLILAVLHLYRHVLITALVLGLAGQLINAFYSTAESAVISANLPTILLTYVLAGALGGAVILIGGRQSDVLEQLLDESQQETEAKEQKAVFLQEQAAALRESLTGTNAAVQQNISSYKEMTAAAQELAEGAEVQNSDVQALSEEAERTAIEANGMQQEVLEASNSADSMAEGAQAFRTELEKLEGETVEMNERFGRLEQEFERVTAKINEADSLSASIIKVGEQTNLLALNASIEAARAGDAGRGFAVVADEIRKLAETSGQAAEGITRVLEELEQANGNALDEMKRSGEAAENQNEAAASMLQASEKMEQGIHQLKSLTASLTGRAAAVQQAASSMNQSTTGLAAGIEQSSAAVEEVSASIEALHEQNEGIGRETAAAEEAVERLSAD